MQKNIKVRMLESKVGSPDGFTNVAYEINGVYDITESLYNSFRRMGACEKVLVTEALETKIETSIITKEALIEQKTTTKKKKGK